MHRRHLISVLAVTAAGLTLLPNSAVAQQKSLKDQLVGTWTLVSWEQTNPDGSKLQKYGSDPRGFHIFEENGRFFAMMARPDLPKIVASDPQKATAEEAKAIMSEPSTLEARG